MSGPRVEHHEVVVVGGGPAGAATAVFLAERGIAATIVEEERFPRFHIGEALTGSVGKLLRALGLESRMHEAGHPVKNGAVVIGATGRNHFVVPAVDALPDGTREPSTTWQVRRSTFDAMLLDVAIERGACLVRGRATAPLVDHGGAVVGVHVETDEGATVMLRSRVVVDASGAGCFLHRAGVTGAKERGRYDAQVAVFSHLEGCDRNPDGQLEPEALDNTVIAYRERHHWAWFIPVDDRQVSVGVVVPTATYRQLGASPETFFERMVVELNPALRARCRSAVPAIPVQAAGNYSYRIRDFVGPGWLCVGDAHRFIDPIFAFGVHFSLFEARMAAEAIDDSLAGRDPAAFERYRRRADDGQDIVQDLIDAFWNEPLAFGYLVHRRHADDIIDIFAGRFYDVVEPSEGLKAVRRINAHALAAR